MSGTPFKTKFTLGLLTIDPCPQEENVHMDVEEKSNDVIAAELAAREAIKAKKAKKKATRQKSGEKSPGKPRGKKKPASRTPSPPPPDLEAKKKAEEEAARKKAEEEARIKAEEEARLKAEEEARIKAAAEAEAAAAEEIRLRKLKEEEERKKAEEAEELSLKDVMDLSVPHVAPPKVDRRKQLTRRVSFFPFTKDNTGLESALRRYNNDVPFDWEDPKHTMDFGDLRHTTTVKSIYGWEKPEWTMKNGLRSARTRQSILQGHRPDWADKNLRKTGLDDLMSDASGRSHYSMDRSLTRRNSFSGMNLADYFEKPEWAKKNLLKSTQAGHAIRMGANLAIPITEIKARMDADSNLHDSMDSMNMSMDLSAKKIDWEKPEWAKGKKLKSTEAGAAVRQGANLAMPIVAKGGAAAEDGVEGEESVASLNLSKNFGEKKIGWEKPSWAKNAGLKRTSTGERMKETGSLAKPIVYGAKS